MKILVVGSGGREHALAWKLARSPQVEEVLCAPGNAGTATEPKARNVAVGVNDFAALVDLAREERVALTIVGPEVPLVGGIVDTFEAAGLKCFGPRAAGAQLEGSKAFTKAFLERHRIPTAAYKTFTDFAAARDYVAAQTPPIVIKADGLAAGKGVSIAATLAEAEATLDRVLRQRQFGQAGARVVIEEFLAGEEASFIAVVDGTRVVPLASSQDHKTRDDGDRGPNTGGMGAYSPAPVVTREVHDRVMREIMLPTVRGLAADGIPYRGFLYAGLMIDGKGQPRVIEFNCRLGDPETQPILFRLRSDLVDLCLSCFDGTLGQLPLEWDSRATVGVVMASRGYPESSDKGKPITGLGRVPRKDVKVFHAGTRLEGGRVVTDGGRVLCVVGTGESVRAARDAAYSGVREIAWDGAFYRSDIGHRAIEREEKSR
ncbi:MAG TPA: phosphoribosylamine--glycine ligase [Gammaproteobacteria bacterium]